MNWVALILGIIQLANSMVKWANDQKLINLEDRAKIGDALSTWLVDLRKIDDARANPDGMSDAFNDDKHPSA